MIYYLIRVLEELKEDLNWQVYLELGLEKIKVDN